MQVSNVKTGGLYCDHIVLKVICLKC